MSKTVIGWAITSPDGDPLAGLVARTRKDAIAALGEHLWPRARKNGCRVIKVSITPLDTHPTAGSEG